jgi:hypothetical protein
MNCGIASFYFLFVKSHWATQIAASDTLIVLTFLYWRNTFVLEHQMYCYYMKNMQNMYDMQSMYNMHKLHI